MQQSFSRSDVRIIIIFHVFLEYSAPEIHSLIQKTLKSLAPTVQSVRKCVSAMKEDRLDMEDLQRSGRSESACNARNVIEKQAG